MVRKRQLFLTFLIKTVICFAAPAIWTAHHVSTETTAVDKSPTDTDLNAALFPSCTFDDADTKTGSKKKDVTAPVAEEEEEQIEQWNISVPVASEHTEK